MTSSEPGGRDFPAVHPVRYLRAVPPAYSVHTAPRDERLALHFSGHHPDCWGAAVRRTGHSLGWWADRTEIIAVTYRRLRTGEQRCSCGRVSPPARRPRLRLVPSPTTGS